MRISSMQYFNMNVSTMSDQQAQLSQLYAQISSGVSSPRRRTIRSARRRRCS